MVKIAKIKNKMITGILKNEPKYVVIDENHIEYKKQNVDKIRK